MSGGPKRNPDRLNTIAVVVVGICSAVLVYVTIVALAGLRGHERARRSLLQTTAMDYGGQDTTAKSHKAEEMRNINEAASNGVAPGTPRRPTRSRSTARWSWLVGRCEEGSSSPVPALPPVAEGDDPAPRICRWRQRS